MKKLFTLLAACLVWAGVSAQTDQPTAPKSVPIGVYVTDQPELIPTIASKVLENKLMQLVTTNGMGADNTAQFFITSLVNINDKQVIAGAPTKVMLEGEVVFYIVDSYTNKVFETTSVSGKGIGTNENKAYISLLKAVQPRNAEVAAFVRRANEKIIAYYESQIDNIVKKADALAKAGSYEEALFELAVVPDICAGYDKVSAQGVEVYQKMIDETAFAAYAKAKNIWGSGHSYEAAVDAGNYLAEVSPYAKCFADAEVLGAEIKKFVMDEHAYERKKEEEALARERKLEDDALAWARKMEEAKMQAEENKELRAHALAEKKITLEQEQLNRERELDKTRTEQEAKKIDAWREVGIAYGQNQKANSYSMDWMSSALKSAIGI